MILPKSRDPLGSGRKLDSCNVQPCNVKPSTPIPLSEGELNMAIDPVCKMKIDEQDAAGQTNYNGKEYFFCSKDCEQKFEADPSQFAEAAA